MGDIPLPDGPIISAPPMLGTGIPIPPPSTEVQGILKKAPMVVLAPGTPTFHGRDPPGVPCGPPPDLLDMDEVSDDEMETDSEVPKLVDNKTKGVRFSDATNEEEDKNTSEMNKFMKEVLTTQEEMQCTIIKYNLIFYTLGKYRTQLDGRK